MIRARRHELQVTQKELERRTGIEQYYLSQIETARKVKQPGKGMLVTIAQALYMDPDILLLAADYAPLCYERGEVDHDGRGTVAVPVRGVENNADMGRTVQIPHAWVEQARFPLFVIESTRCGPGSIMTGDSVVCEEYHGQAIEHGAIVFVGYGHEDSVRTTLAAYVPMGDVTIIGVARQRFGPPS